jgi:DNA-binding Lrp family transcriptional regulator
MTEDERKIVEVLVNHPRTPNAWEDPILSVAQAMGWQVSQAEQRVRKLVGRKMIQPVTVARGWKEPMRSEWWWEKGPEGK